MPKGIDCATKLTVTTAKAIKQAGYDYVMRYLGTNWKSFDKAEAKAIQAAGLHLVSVYESSPTHDSYFTPEQGKEDAQKATEYAKAVGQPNGSAIYFAVDYGGGNANVGKIKEYFKAIKAVLKDYKVGGYGSYVVVKYLHEQGVIDYVWQTYAWSNGQVYQGHMWQYKNGQHVARVQVDLDEVFKSPGHWVEPVQLDYKKPVVKYSLPTGILKQGDKGSKVKQLQEVLNHLNFKCGKADGDYGPKTADAVKRFQSVYLPHDVDSIYGPQTKKAMEKQL